VKCRIVFFGTSSFAAIQLQALLATPLVEVAAVVTQPDRPAGRGGRLSPSPVKLLSQAHGLEPLQPGNIKRELSDFLTALESLGPYDLGVVAAFGQIIPKKILAVPLAGMVNVHASLLPRWRGAAPIHRAIISGDKVTGVCLMQMEPTLDTGPVYVAEQIPIGDHDTFGTLESKLAECGARLLQANIIACASGTLPQTPQDQSKATYAEKIGNSEAKIDWTLAAVQIERLIRGLNPAPGAFTELRKNRLKIFKALIKPGSAVDRPGSIVAVDKHLLEIQCGEGRLALTEVQLEGKGRLPVDAFLRGCSLRIGDCLQ